MPDFASIIDQHQSLRRLAAIVLTGRIPGALLFSGQQGVGRRSSALAFAKALNCTENHRLGSSRNRPADPSPEKMIAAANPCGHCRACRKMSSGSHPDLIQIAPKGSAIKIDQIRQLQHALAMTPYEARQRVVIIADAHAMTPEAGNALLKSLEEPPERTTLILVAHQATDLLPTIVSRCQHLRFNPISARGLRDLLIRAKGLAENDAGILADMAHGSFTHALAMSEAGWVRRRNWMIAEIESLPSRPVAVILAFAVRLGRKREELIASLDVINTWFRDLAVFKYAPDKIINKDLTDRIQYASQQVEVRGILSKIETIRTAQRHILSNANTRVALEVMLLRLAKT